MHLPRLTLDQIQYRCTAQSFSRGEEYFEIGMIGEPVLHGYTLASTCEGSEETLYNVSVELAPTGIADTYCSCPYSYGGDCKHIVALLLTYIHEPETICSLDALFAALAEKPKESLLHVISELLKRTPDTVPVVRHAADIVEETEVGIDSTADELGAYTTIIDEVLEIDPASTPHEPTDDVIVAVYREQIDRLFGDDFLEQHQLHKVLGQLEGLMAHTEWLAQVGETEFALSVLHSLIYQSIIRYAHTRQEEELPTFVKTCAKKFIHFTTNAQQPDVLLAHYRMLLDLSFEAAPVFTPILVDLLEHPVLPTIDLEAEIEQRLDESPDPQAHVRLLLTCYLRTQRTKDYLRLARREGESYRLIHALFVNHDYNAAWQALVEFPLSVEEYADLLKSPIVTSIPGLTDKLIALIKHHQPDTAIPLYQYLIEQTVLSRKREAYEKVRHYLTTLIALYSDCDQEEQWRVYLATFRKRHARKRLLLQVIENI